MREKIPDEYGKEVWHHGTPHELWYAMPGIRGYASLKRVIRWKTVAEWEEEERINALHQEALAINKEYDLQRAVGETVEQQQKRSI